MIKRVSTVKFNEDNGEVYHNNTVDYKSKLWADGKGAILKPRNYHCTIYQDNRLCDIIEDRNDLLRTYILIEHIYKNTNIIYAQKSKTIYKPASVEDISDILGIRLRLTKEYLNRMIDLGIIAKLIMKIEDEEYISYVFNPVFVNSCKYINNTLYLLFKPYIDKCMPEWIKEKYAELNKELNSDF